MPAAVLSNLNSRRNRTHTNAVRGLLDACPDVIHVETRAPAEIPGQLEALRERGVDCLAINGGDGTVQHVLTLMLNGSWPQPPALVTIPGGTTNMTAHDLNGAKLGLLPALRAFLERVRAPEPATIDRHAIAVENPDEATQYGFFFGMGAVVSGIQYCHERIYSMGLSDEIAPGVALLRAMYGIARREPVFSDGLPVTLRTQDCVEDARASILCVSALERLFLGMTPFWGDGDGALAMTLVRESPRRLLRTLPALLRGRPDHRLTEANGYQSRRLDALRIEGQGQFTLDGEIFGPSTSHLDVRAAGPLRILPLADSRQGRGRPRP